MNEPLTPLESQPTERRAAVSAAEVVLSISAAAEDHAALRGILRPIALDVLEAECCEEAFRFLSGVPVAAIIADEFLPDGDWRRVLRHTLSRSDPPRLIVASRLADEVLWAEVLKLGGCDLLAKPFDAVEVRRAVLLARPPGTERTAPGCAQPKPAVTAAAA